MKSDQVFADAVDMELCAEDSLDAVRANLDLQVAIFLMLKAIYLKMDEADSQRP